jgi:hypothetical protein
MLASQIALADTAILDWQPVYTDILYRQLVAGELYGYALYWGYGSGNYLGRIPVRDTTYEATGLADDTVYYFAVTAVSGQGFESAYSAEVQVDTTAPPPPEEPPPPPLPPGCE